MKSITEKLVNSIVESSETEKSLLKGFVSPSQYRYSDKCVFSEEEAQKLIDLQPDKDIKIARNGSLMFNYTVNSRADVLKFIKNNDRYIIRRTRRGAGYYTHNTIDEHPLHPDKNNNKWWFDSFEDMYEYAKKYIDKRNKGIVK